MSFTAGATNSVSIKDNAATSYTELCDFRHSMSISDEGHEITSSCHEGVQAFISSVLRGEGTASFHIRSTQYPWSGSINIKAQAKGLLKFEFGDAQQFVFPYYISRVQYENETAGGSDYTASFKLNAEAGSLSYPS